MNKYLILVFSIVCFSCVTDPVEPDEVDCALSGLELSEESVTPSTCNESTGSVSVKASGGEEPYQYRIGSGSFQSSEMFSSLSSGLYTIEVKDKNDCTSELEVTVTNSEGPAITNVSTFDAGCGEKNGSIAVTASGGSGTLLYKLVGGDYSESPMFSNLEAGEYTIVIKDENDCEFMAEAFVPNGTPFSSIRAVLNQSCAVSGCHVAGTGLINLTSNSTVVDNSNSIVTNIVNGNMPPRTSSQSISQEEIDLISCWVNDGSPLN